jgi:DNA-binding protein H-NS
MARAVRGRGNRKMSETDTGDIRSQELERETPDPTQLDEEEILSFLERAFGQLSVASLGRINTLVVEKLQAKQEEARRTARQAIEAQLQATGLSLRDLFPELLPGRRSGEAGSIPPKYQGPNGEEWSGRGHTPKWLTALEATGRQREEFRIREETGQERKLSAATIEDI